MASTPLMPSGLFGSGCGGANPGQLLATGGGAGWNSFIQAQMGQQGMQGMQQSNAYNGYSRGWEDPTIPLTNNVEQAKLAVERLKAQQTAAKDEKVENKELLPDVSLTRVFKWALIVLVAVALGEKIWSKLGPSLTDNFCKVLGHAPEKTSA